MLELIKKISTIKTLIFDIYLLVTKSLNPFLLDMSDKNKHEMIRTLQKECMPQRIYQHICKEKNFCYLNGKNVLQPKVSEKIIYFLNKVEVNYKDLRNNLS